MGTSFEEIKWAIKQLEALEYVSVTGHGDEARVSITEKGMLRARDIIEARHDTQEKFLIALYYLKRGEDVKAEELTGT